MENRTGNPPIQGEGEGQNAPEFISSHLPPPCCLQIGRESDPGTDHGSHENK